MFIWVDGPSAMPRTQVLPSPGVALPDRRLVVDYAYVTYFVLLLLAPLTVPPVIVEVASVAYVDAVFGVLPAVAVGYVAGLAVLLRPI